MHAPKANFRASSRVPAAMALLATMASSAAAGTWWTVADDGEAGVNGQAVLQSPQVAVDWYSDAGLAVTVDVAGLEFAVEQTKGGEFLRVTCPATALDGEIGEPALPAIRRLFVVPEGAAVGLEVTQGQASVIDLAAAGFGVPVMPMQPPIPMIPGARERAPFHHQEGAYAADCLLPTERAAISELGRVRGQRVYLLEVLPVAYNPACGTLP